MPFALHAGFNMANACRALFILALMFSSVSLVWLILLPRYMISLTSDTAFPETLTGPFCWLLMLSNLVFSWLILSKPFLLWFQDFSLSFACFSDSAKIELSRQ